MFNILHYKMSYLFVALSLTLSGHGVSVVVNQSGNCVGPDGCVVEGLMWVVAGVALTVLTWHVDNENSRFASKSGGTE